MRVVPAVLLCLVVASNGVSAANDPVPHFNLAPACEAVQKEIAGGRTAQACERDEEQAHGALTNQWASFPATDRLRCTSLTTLGGMPSYVELLTCLEMAREVRALRDKENLATGATGLARDPAGNAAD